MILLRLFKIGKRNGRCLEKLAEKLPEKLQKTGERLENPKSVIADHFGDPHTAKCDKSWQPFSRARRKAPGWRKWHFPSRAQSPLCGHIARFSREIPRHCRFAKPENRSFLPFNAMLNPPRKSTGGRTDSATVEKRQLGRLDALISPPPSVFWGSRSPRIAQKQITKGGRERVLSSQ